MTIRPIQSLPKQCRLRKANEFRSVLRNRAIFESFHLRLYIKPQAGNHNNCARIGLIVAKKIERKAVKRNRVKRLIREAFRRHQQVICGVDCVIQLKRSVELFNFALIYQEAVMLLNKAAKQ